MEGGAVAGGALYGDAVRGAALGIGEGIAPAAGGGGA